jgi:acetyltransferase-like isoleucine patch superfamily enzyme
MLMLVPWLTLRATVGSRASNCKGCTPLRWRRYWWCFRAVTSSPVIEDGALLVPRCIVVEGVHVGKEAVLGANVCLTAQLKLLM